MKHEMTIGLNHQNGTDTIDQDYAVRAIGEKLQACTIFPCFGYWNGARENSLRVEIYSDESDGARLRRAAAELCVELHQDCIIVDGEFVTARA